MKHLELKHVVCYPLGEDGIKMMTSLTQGGFITPIAQIDFTEPDFVYGNSYLDIDDAYYPYTLKGAHLILRPLEDLRKGDHDMELAEIIGLQNAGHLIDSLIADSLYSMDSTVWNMVSEYLDKNGFDWRFELIGNGLAIDINTIKQYQP